MDFAEPFSDRLKQQLTFIREIDKVKQIFRQTYLNDATRHENDAEHSWHLAIMAVLLAEHAEVELDIIRIVKMVLIHDIVEIDAGDVHLYSVDRNSDDKVVKEKAAADRIFGMLPDDQTQELRELWDEFETRQTPESRFAGSLDRLQPLLHNYFTEGKSWKEHGITRSQVLAMNGYIQEGSELLWKLAQRLIDDSVEKGYLKP